MSAWLKYSRFLPCSEFRCQSWVVSHKNLIPDDAGCVTINIYVCVAMPLASVEEWRARIGSSWCALGRPFKMRKSSGNYRSFGAVSGSAMLQAIASVYVLVAMVLALTRDTTVAALVRGVESINGCVSECQRQIKSEFGQNYSTDLKNANYHPPTCSSRMWLITCCYSSVPHKFVVAILYSLV